MSTTFCFSFLNACQEPGGRDITAVTAPKLIDQLKLFEDNGLIINDVDLNVSQRLSNVNAATLQDGCKIHKTCYDRYNQLDKYHRESLQPHDPKQGPACNRPSPERKIRTAFERDELLLPRSWHSGE